MKEMDYEILELEVNGNYFEYLGQELRRLPGVASRYHLDAAMRSPEYYSQQTLLSTLEGLSRQDKESGSLLCFGYHLLARKR